MVIVLAAADGHRRGLEPGEHKAFYFLFTPSRGKAHGFVRPPLARDSVLEWVTLRQIAYRLAAGHLARRIRPVPGTLTVIVAILE